jgi:hypothetical protein
VFQSSFKCWNVGLGTLSIQCASTINKWRALPRYFQLPKKPILLFRASKLFGCGMDFIHLLLLQWGSKLKVNHLLPPPPPFLTLGDTTNLPTTHEAHIRVKFSKWGRDCINLLFLQWDSNLKSNFFLSRTLGSTSLQRLESTLFQMIWYYKINGLSPLFNQLLIHSIN